MEKRLKNYLAFMEKLTEQKEELPGRDVAGLLSGLLVQIQFFQHERLVHLIVTVTFAILAFLAFLGCMLTSRPEVSALVVLLLLLLVPYIRHYYILENGVQKLYVYYDFFAEICSK